jgi:hypothetical protein
LYSTKTCFQKCNISPADPRWIESDETVFKGQSIDVQKHFGAILQISDSLMARILLFQWETIATCHLGDTLYNLSVLWLEFCCPEIVITAKCEYAKVRQI